MIETNNPFDQLADEYDAYRGAYSRTLYDALFEQGFKVGMEVLDVACGTGLASEPLLKRGLKVTGVDISEPMMEKGRARHKGLEFVRGDAHELPFATRSFDAVICAQAMHWMDQAKALAEMTRVVRPGGRIAVWWKKMAVDEPLRAVRQSAGLAVGVEQPEDIMANGFRAFYQHEFKDRSLRVVPQVIMTDVERWMGYERSRARQAHFGEKLGVYLDELERQMRETAQGKPFQVKYAQFLYIGEV